MRKLSLRTYFIIGAILALISGVLAVIYGGKILRENAAESKALIEKDKDGFRLIWSDEFSDDGPPDTAKWGFENGFVRNKEDQWYQQDNARCEDGILIIEARKETKPNPTYIAGSTDWKTSRPEIAYTSSSLITSGKHSWQYGRFVMRGKIDISMGLWPAWWTLGVDGEWPSNGEIDILEFYRKQLLFNIANATQTRYTPQWFSRVVPVDSIGGEDWASKYHIWRMDWDENAISLFLDDQLMIKTELDKLVNKDDKGLNPFKQPHFMILNLALGGMNGGDLSETRFPNRLEVDYVRVYQK